MARITVLLYLAPIIPFTLAYPTLRGLNHHARAAAPAISPTQATQAIKDLTFAKDCYSSYISTVKANSPPSANLLSTIAVCDTHYGRASTVIGEPKNLNQSPFTEKDKQLFEETAELMMTAHEAKIDANNNRPYVLKARIVSSEPFHSLAVHSGDLIEEVELTIDEFDMQVHLLENTSVQNVTEELLSRADGLSDDGDVIIDEAINSLDDMQAALNDVPEEEAAEAGAIIDINNQNIQDLVNRHEEIKARLGEVVDNLP